MRYVEAKKCEVIPIGRQGENEVETVQFDVSGWAEEYGDGTFTLLHQRSRDTAPYECPIVVDGETVNWTVRNTDTAYGGLGEAQLIYTVNEAVAKSVIFETKTHNSLDGDVVLPDPYDDWLKEIHEDAEFTRENMDKVVQAEEYAEIAEEKAREASAFVGSPLTASLENEMTDHDKVYVYVGNEVGMNNGDWYYWDGTAWVDGGVYNSIAIDTDTTLSEAGKAADAKAVGDKITELSAAFSAENSIIFELGTINAGIPVVSNKYVRNVDFVHANKNDAIIITPTEFTINGAIYLYSKPQTESYISATTIATIQIGNTYTYTFTNECYFKMRAQKDGAPVLSSTDVQKFESAIKHFHNYSYSDFELSKNDAIALPIDYATITAAMTGKVNFVLQTDLHMSAFYRYNGTTKWNPSDFTTFESVVKTMAKLNADGLIDLGDTVAGYGFDPDYETRESLDKIIKTYRDYYPSEEKFFLIGNHDDGNAFYYNTTYNDKQSVEDVIYPSEQFNRIVKHGNNNGYVQNFYYKDVNGIRIIVLYQRDFDYSTDIPRIEEFGIGSDQINWLTNTALDTNLPVLVLTHASLASSIYNTSRTGFDAVLTALDTFEQNGGTVIAVLSGHKHAEANTTVNGINHIVFANGYVFFYLISIDLTNHTVTCTPINNTALNVRTFNY